MTNLLLILFGKLISKFFRLLNLGDGSTWPGHIALNLNKNFVSEVLNKSQTQTIVVAGTNGKTTTASLIKSALKKNGKRVFLNKSGANLLNGIASSLIINSTLSGILNYDFAILEIDENSLPPLLKQITPNYVILLNLFRDQLDRYGEVNIVSSHWSDTIAKLKGDTTMIINADDPQISFITRDTHAKTLFFGVNDLSASDKTSDNTADSNYCPKCGNKLSYNSVVFSHLGDWFCEKCNLRRPKLDLNNFPTYPLPGIYNKYNTHATVLVLRELGFNENDIEESFSDFKPAFGRQEELSYKNKTIQIFLSKNPTSFNQSFNTVLDLKAKTLLIVLNDRIPDGRDVSWIWDVDLSGVKKFKNIILSGDRVYDIALRLKYEEYNNFHVCENLEEGIERGISLLDENETLFILPTYSAMLEVRKILTGKKIL